MSRSRKKGRPIAGQRWLRRRTGELVLVVAITNPRGPTPAYVVVESDAGRASAVRLDLWRDSYEEPTA